MDLVTVQISVSFVDIAFPARSTMLSFRSSNVVILIQLSKYTRVEKWYCGWFGLIVRPMYILK